MLISRGFFSLSSAQTTAKLPSSFLGTSNVVKVGDEKFEISSLLKPVTAISSLFSLIY